MLTIEFPIQCMLFTPLRTKVSWTPAQARGGCTPAPGPRNPCRPSRRTPCWSRHQSPLCSMSGRWAPISSEESGGLLQHCPDTAQCRKLGAMSQNAPIGEIGGLSKKELGIFVSLRLSICDRNSASQLGRSVCTSGGTLFD